MKQRVAEESCARDGRREDCAVGCSGGVVEGVLEVCWRGGGCGRDEDGRWVEG